MAERHAAEGRMRTLVAKLEREGRQMLLPEARRMLANMELTQRQFEEHAAAKARWTPRSN
jgi:hypothetical protein